MNTPEYFDNFPFDIQEKIMEKVWDNYSYEHRVIEQYKNHEEVLYRLYELYTTHELADGPLWDETGSIPDDLFPII